MMTIQVGLEEAAARGSDSTYNGVRWNGLAFQVMIAGMEGNVFEKQFVGKIDDSVHFTALLKTVSELFPTE